MARERQIDVAFFPRDVAPRLDVPVVVLANNMYAWRSYGTGAAIGGRVPALLLRVMARRSVERSAAVLAVSQSMAEVVAGGVTAVVHHGCLHPPVLRSAETGGERPIVVTVVGNLNENKQTDLVLRGVAAATGGPWDLRVYGVRADEAYAAEVEALSCELFDRSVLEGPVVGPDLVDVYRQTDLVVVGGTFESFCHPLVEAMRAGATVVAPDTPLVAELCGDVAVTYEPGDHRSLADALLVATAERGERGPRGVERSASFTWTATVRRTLAVVRAAVSEVQGVPGAPAAVSAPPTAGEPGGGSGRATQASTPRSGAG